MNMNLSCEPVLLEQHEACQADLRFAVENDFITTGAATNVSAEMAPLGFPEAQGMVFSGRLSDGFR